MRTRVLPTALILAVASMTFAAEETLQNDDGICIEDIGCSDGAGTGGNPNDLVECFSSASLTAPFDLTQAYYEIGPSVPAPDALSLKVYEWIGAGPPGTLIATVPLGAADRTIGPHTVALAPPVTITTQFFCVGLNGGAANDGFRANHSQTQTVAGASWVLAPTCGANVFTELANVGFPGNWCFRPTISDGVATGACCDDGPGTMSDCIVATEDECVSAGGTYLGDDVPCTPDTDCTALLVTMESMRAVATPDGVQISWTTLMELDTVGFRLLRQSGTREKATVVVAAMIPAQGTNLSGATYQYLDNSPEATTSALYYVEDIDIFGKVTRHGPIAVEPGVRTRPAQTRQR